MESIHLSIDKLTQQLRQEGYSEEDIQYMWHNALNAFKKRVASEKLRDVKNLTAKRFEQRKVFTVQKDLGESIVGRWTDNPQSREIDKKKFLQMLEDRVIWWEE